MEKIGIKDGLAIIAKMHVSDQETLRNYIPEAVRLGVNVFGGSAERHSHACMSSYERNLRILYKIRNESGIPAIAEVRPSEMIEDMGYMSPLFKANDKVDVLHVFPELSSEYSIDGRRRVDVGLLNELGIVKRSKPIILGMSSENSVDDYSRIATSLIAAGHNLILSIGARDDIGKISYLRMRHPNPVYVDAGDISSLDNHLLEDVQNGIDLGAKGVIAEIHVNGSGLDPLRRLSDYVHRENSHIYRGTDRTQ